MRLITAVIAIFCLNSVNSFAQDVPLPKGSSAKGEKSATTTEVEKKTTTVIEKKTDSTPVEKSSRTEKSNAESQPQPPAQTESPTQPPSPTQSQTPTRTTESEYPGAGMLLPWAKVGPTIGIGLPVLLDLGLEARILNQFGFGIGFMPTLSKKISWKTADDPLAPELTVTLSSWNVHAHWFPFSGGFLVGAKLGVQNIGGKIDVVFAETTTSLNFHKISPQIESRSVFFTPKIGYQNTLENGFTIGSEIGWQFPTSSSATSDVIYGDSISPAAKQAAESTDEAISAKSKLKDFGKRIAESSLPYWNIVTIGWLF